MIVLAWCASVKAERSPIGHSQNNCVRNDAFHSTVVRLVSSNQVVLVVKSKKIDIFGIFGQFYQIDEGFHADEVCAETQRLTGPTNSPGCSACVRSREIQKVRIHRELWTIR